ncbi:MAG: glutamate-5-semialdehyde dehydrogenase, partial [Hyphomicrobiaceae bacterium]
MNIATRIDPSAQPVAAAMRDIGEAGREAAQVLATASPETKNTALQAMARDLRDASNELISANAMDLGAARTANKPAAFIDRLALDADRIEAMAKSLEDIAGLDDPVGEVIASWDRPNGLQIERVRQPIGVIGIIYESRPNVTSDAAGLCLKSGNAAILRGGSDSIHSAQAIEACLHAGLGEAGLPKSAIQVVPTVDREAVGLMLAGLGGNIDLIVPRGGRSLVERVQTDARVPVFAHLEGVCHVYVDKSADLAMAKAIIVNAKMRRTGICGAAETLLVDEADADRLLAPLVTALLKAGCEVRGDKATQAVSEKVVAAVDEDWPNEFLDTIISVRTVHGVDGALDHIQTHGSEHTEAIVAEDSSAVEKFLNGCN